LLANRPLCSKNTTGSSQRTAAASIPTTSAGVDGAYRHLVEFRGHFAEAVQGENVTVEIFQPGDKVKVSGTGIGKGFQGTIKRHNFGRGPVTHGSHNVRKPGSIGASATPSRVFKGVRMAGRMGAVRQTTQNLTVHAVDAERGLLLIKGAVPGPRGSVVLVKTAAKGA